MGFPLGTIDLQILCDALDDGVLIFDHEDRVLFGNPAASRFLRVNVADLGGMRARAIVTRVLGVSHDDAMMLFVGETVFCPGPGEGVEGFDVRWLRLASRPSREDAGGRLQETASAMIIRDRSRGRRLRAMEDAASSSESARWRIRSGVEMLEPRAILQFLSVETRRANRDGEPLSVVMVRSPMGLNLEQQESWLTPVLRASDRVGTLRTGTDVGAEGAESSEVTIAALAVPLHPECGWNLVVLPYARKTGAHAVGLRIRARAPAEIARNVFIGVATLNLRRSEWMTGAGADTAESLLERAYADLVRDERERDESSAA